MNTPHNGINVCVSNLGKYNEGYNDFEWIHLPISNSDWNTVCKRIGISAEENEFGEVYEEVFFSDWENYYPFDIKEIIGEYADVKSCNQLAYALEELDDKQLKIVQATLDEGISNLEEAICNAYKGNCFLDESVKDEYDVGKYFTDEYGGVSNLPDKTINDYFDYKDFGEILSHDEYSVPLEPEEKDILEMINLQENIILSKVTDNIWRGNDENIELSTCAIGDFYYDLELRDDDKYELQIGEDGERITGENIDGKIVFEDERGITCTIDNISGNNIVLAVNTDEMQREFETDVNLDGDDAKMISAKEYFCGDDNVSDYQLGVEYVEVNGFEGVGLDRFEHFDYTSYGRDSLDGWDYSLSDGGLLCAIDFDSNLTYEDVGLEYDEEDLNLQKEETAPATPSNASPKRSIAQRKVDALEKAKGQTKQKNERTIDDIDK